MALKDLQTKIESTLVSRGACVRMPCQAMLWLTVQKQFNPALEALIRVVNEKFSQAFARELVELRLGAAS